MPFHRAGRDSLFQMAKDLEGSKVVIKINIIIIVVVVVVVVATLRENKGVPRNGGRR